DWNTGGSSQSSPSQSSPSMMASIAACVERARSVSSIRSSALPPWWRAKSQLNSAVRAPPICRKPVGEGAKRATTGRRPVDPPALLALAFVPAMLSYAQMLSEATLVGDSSDETAERAALQHGPWPSLRL